MGDGAVLAPDSFLMKGEEIAPGGRWGGNPAIAIFDTVDDLPDALRPASDRPGHTRPVADRPAAVPSRLRLAAVALGALIVLALSGGTAVVVGVRVPFGPAAHTSAVPAVAPPAPAPAPSAAPAPTAVPTTAARATATKAPAKRTTARATSATTKPRATRASTRTTTSARSASTTTDGDQR
jgi:hypothetical protein